MARSSSIPMWTTETSVTRLTPWTRHWRFVSPTRPRVLTPGLMRISCGDWTVVFKIGQWYRIRVKAGLTTLWLPEVQVSGVDREWAEPFWHGWTPDGGFCQWRESEVVPHHVIDITTVS